MVACDPLAIPAPTLTLESIMAGAPGAQTCRGTLGEGTGRRSRRE
jgi:hypothetical protein